MDKTERKRANTRLTIKLSALVVGMFAFGFALVPLYDVFCDLTGLNGKTGPIVEAAAIAGQQVDRSRTVTVEFVATLNQSMDWEFRPTEGELQIHFAKRQDVVIWALEEVPLASARRRGAPAPATRTSG